MMAGMERAFIFVMQKSLSASVVVLCLLGLRVLLKRYPKKYSYALWGALGLRLLWIWPVKSWLGIFRFGIFQSPVWRQVEAVPEQMGTPEMVSGAGGVWLPAVENAGGQRPGQAVTATERLWPKLLLVGTILWMVGMIAFLAYLVISYGLMQRNVRCGVRLRENIYQCDGIGTPFVMGIFSPRIYLPFHMEKVQMMYVIYHEKYHIKRRDYLVKLLAFLLLGIYWFHPLMWLSYVLMCQDMEMSCDEAVVERLGMSSKRAYSATLLALAAGKRMPGNLLGFGEKGIKGRIKNVLGFQGAKGRKVSVLSLLCILSLVAFGCDSVQLEKEEEVKTVSDETVTQEAKELFAAKTSYLGDASGTGNLIHLLQEQGYLYQGEYGIELETEEEDEGILRIHFEEEPSSEDDMTLQTSDGATLLLALIDNLQQVQWTYPKMEEGEKVLMTYYWEQKDVEAMLPEVTDVKDCGKSQEQLQWLMSRLGDAATAQTVRQPLADKVAVIGGAEGPTSVFLAGKSDMTELDSAIDAYILEENSGTMAKGNIQVCSHVRLQEEAPEEDGISFVYLWTLYEEYTYREGEALELTSGVQIPACMKLKQGSQGGYELVSYWTPGDGEQMQEDIQKVFPKELWKDALDSQKYQEILQKECKEQAEKYAQYYQQLTRKDGVVEENTEKTVGAAAGEENIEGPESAVGYGENTLVEDY